MPVEHPTTDAILVAPNLPPVPNELLRLLRSPNLTPENFIAAHKELAAAVLTGELDAALAEAAVRILEGALAHVMMIEKRSAVTPPNHINVLVQNLLGANPVDALADMRPRQLIEAEE